ncbi:MAG: hypothetical protein K8F91_24190, partial [Candidatus Obscuribacterales bacterium]|nr:hypothetical protein [Candidatus Obscuribacterales bacterium]
MLLVLGTFFLTTILTQFYNTSGAATRDQVKEKNSDFFDFTLEEAKAPQISLPTFEHVKSENFLEERLKELLSLLNPLKEAKEKPFVLPEQSIIKPALPGNRIQEKFPPDASSLAKPQVDLKQEDLKVVRISHTGSVDTVGQFTVTFSQPMVPVAAARLETNPEKFIAMTPQPKGTWRWLGTQTLLFEPDGNRFPRATIYQLSVPEGTKSVNGGVLKQAKNWTITTSELSVKSFLPYEGTPQDSTPSIVAIFNQEIDRRSVFEHLSVKANGLDYPVKIVDKSGLGDEYGVKQLPDDEWLAVRPVNPLPRSKGVVVTFRKGCKSKEG